MKRVKPNWIPLVVHRPIQEHRKGKNKNTWIVSERETTAIVMSQSIAPKDDEGKMQRIRSKEDAVALALERIEKVGKETVLKNMKAFREKGRDALLIS